MQKLRFSRYFKPLLVVTDIVVLSAVLIYYFLRNHDFAYAMDGHEEEYSLSLLLLVLFWILLSGRTKLYSIPRNITYTIYLERLLSHILIFIFGMILLAKASNNNFLKEDRFLISFTLFFMLSFIKSILFFGLKFARTLGYNHRNVMFLCESNSAALLKELLLKRKDYGFKIFEYPNKDSINIDELVEFWQRNGIYNVYLPSEEKAIEKGLEKEIFRQAQLHKVKIGLIPDIVKNNFFRYDLTYIETQPVLVQAKFPLDFMANYVVKRTFDLLFSVLMLLCVCSWLFPIIALWIYLTDRGPVFFLQKRYGYHDQIFNCIKFRTMVVNTDCHQKTTEKNDKRITKAGRFLRKTSLDELPQFINVLLGDMSVVGPRPHMLRVDDYYKPKIGRYSVRSLVKPGITGLAQVNGLRGDSGDMNVEMKKRILADAFYVKNWSPVLDLVIVLKTAYLMLTGDKKAA